GGRFGRFLYERLNLSLRVLLPSGFADRTKLTKALHRQYLAPIEDPTARGAVLWPLARALTSSTAHYRGIEAGLGRLRDLPVQLIWGMKDPAFGPDVLARWKEAFPRADVVELPVGHWPQEEAPEAVIAALRRFLLVT